MKTVYYNTDILSNKTGCIYLAIIFITKIEICTPCYDNNLFPPQAIFMFIVNRSGLFKVTFNHFHEIKINKFVQ